VPAGWPNPLEVSVVDDCGAPVTEGSVVATFSNGDPPLPLVSLKNGRWARTWQARKAEVSQITVAVTAEIAEKQLKGVTQVTGGLRASTGSPQIGAGAVLSAVSFAPDAPISPGSMIAIFGSRLANGQGQAERFPLEMQMAGALATLGGRPLPLMYASEGQINAVVPYGLPVNTRQQLVVRRGEAYTVPESVAVAAAQPAVFSKNGSGQGQGLIVAENGGLAEPGNAVRPGSVVVIYCSGLGEVTPGVQAEQPAPDEPLARAANLVKVTMGGAEARVDFAGLVPRYTGFFQINAVVPEGAEKGDSVPVVVTVAGQSSMPVTMAVQ
jgi:uncharacterized protein (TIGR03437 family)